MTRGWLVGGAAFLVLLLVVAVVVAIAEGEKSFDDGTPEATVQGFLKAVEDEDLQLAHEFLSQELRDECPFDEFFSRAGRPGERLRYDRISLKQTKIEGDIAFVTVRVTTFQGSGPFGTSEFSRDQRFALSRQDGTWLFSEYPWPFFECGPYKQPVEPIRVPPPPVREPVP